MSTSNFLDICQELKLTQEHIFSLIYFKERVDPILAYLPRTIPNFTDHGVLHSENVLKIIKEYRKNASIIVSVKAGEGKQK